MYNRLFFLTKWRSSLKTQRNHRSELSLYLLYDSMSRLCRLSSLSEHCALNVTCLNTCIGTFFKPKISYIAGLATQHGILWMNRIFVIMYNNNTVEVPNSRLNNWLASSLFSVLLRLRWQRFDSWPRHICLGVLCKGMERTLVNLALHTGDLKATLYVC